MPPHLLRRFAGGNVTEENWDRQLYDQSFMVTKIAFWRSEEVRSWLNAMDRSVALHATTVPTLALLLFAGERGVYRFQEWSYLCSGALGVSLRSLVPSASLAGLLPERAEWAGDLQELKADPRYKHEAAWLYRNIMTPVNTGEYWCFRILKYVR
uniref:Uncharacterized protein n=1 Tax=Alexandrium catenella TaxID=2925 RepID=A0A7S1WFT8_ALECA